MDNSAKTKHESVPIALPKDIQEAVRRAGDQPVHLRDVEGDADYVIMPIKTYEQIISALPPDLFTEEEQVNLLLAAGLSAAWDDPANDIYNDLDPRRK